MDKIIDEGTVIMGKKVTDELLSQFENPQIKQASEYQSASIEQTLADFRRWLTVLTVTHAGTSPKTLLELLLQDSLDFATDSNASVIDNVQWLTRAREVAKLREEIAKQTSGELEQNLAEALNRAIAIFEPVWLTEDILRACWQRHFIPEKATVEHKERFMEYFGKYLHQGGFLFEYQNQLNEQFIIQQVEYAPFAEGETSVFFRNRPGAEDRLRISIRVNKSDIQVESALRFGGLCMHTDDLIYKLIPKPDEAPELTAKFRLAIEGEQVVPRVELDSAKSEIVNIMQQCDHEVYDRFLVITQNNQTSVAKGGSRNFNDLLDIQGRDGTVSVKALPAGLPEQEQKGWINKWEKGITDDYEVISNRQGRLGVAKLKFQQWLSELFNKARTAFARVMNIVWPRAQVTERQEDEQGYQPISQVEKEPGEYEPPHP
jgi:hypothetical protein